MREDRQRRLIRKAQKIREQLGGLAKLLEPFPQKPTQMHRKTSWRLRQAGLNASVPLLAIGLLARAGLISFTPPFEARGLSRVITVQPLGGCPMGRNEHEGVVDSYGQVFNYPGLYVADSSVMPGPVGPNPSLTIAALADRILANVRHW